MSGREQQEEGQENDSFIEANVQVVEVKPTRFRNFLKFLVSFVTSEKQREQVNADIETKLWRMPPLFFIFFTLFQISVFMYYYIRYHYKLTDDPIELFVFVGGCYTSIFSISPMYPYEVWRLVTHSFLHLWEYHLFKNMIVQVFLGIPQEIAFRFPKIAPLYFGGIMFSEIVMRTFQERSIFLCGASGGDYALIFAQVANLIVNWKEVPYRKVQALVIFVNVAADCGEDFKNVLMGKQINYDHGTHSHAAIYGLLYGFCFLYFKGETAKWRAARLTFIALYILVLIGCIIQNINIYIHDETVYALDESLFAGSTNATFF
ncbi:unnamed protein product [Caenorhabditis angaria]|uniref:Peptidase S54 rhomboid domain-containing protein n=1 Tax=Caenorhabditis angaria TaxID=860376 RepID=A0A9P1J1J4_9PELO|nr:unnamed protein product [Caenorhabditis angaria]